MFELEVSSITLFHLIKMLLLLLIHLLIFLNMDIIFIYVIILIQRRRIRTAVLGMASCHKTTRHVIGLDLSCSWLNGSIHSNSTLFFLPHLKRLNLAGNFFNYSPISSEFAYFKTLSHLNLSNSMFSVKIPYEISHLSSLVSLDLSYND